MEILLTSEAFVKSVTNVSDNLSGKFILPSIREAQEINLRQILGDCLLDSLKRKVADGSISEEGNEAYHDLLDQCQYFLAYKTIVEVTNKVAYKIANAGVTKTSDENVYNASYDEIVKMQYYYQSKADSHTYMLQGWILGHKQAFPELKACDCRRIKSNLFSAATSGLWLGGARGRGPSQGKEVCK